MILVDNETSIEKTFLTLPDVYVEHYHSAEFFNGNLYIIRRFGVNSDGTTRSDWSDNLWKYSLDGSSEKLFSAKGIDFRVSPETGRTAILYVPDEQKALETTIAFIDLEGKITATDEGKALQGMDGTKILRIKGWQERIFWFGAHQGALMTNLYAFDADAESVSARDTSDLPTELKP